MRATSRLPLRILTCSAPVLLAPALAAQGPTPTPKTEITDGVSFSSNTQTITIYPDTDVVGLGAPDVRFEFQSLVDAASGGGGPGLPAPLPPPILSQAFRTWTFHVIEIGTGIPGPDQVPLELEAIRPKDATQNVQIEVVDADTLILHWIGCVLPGSPGESIDVHLQIDVPQGEPDTIWTLSADSHLSDHVLFSGSYSFGFQENPDVLDELLVSTGVLVSDPSQHLIANEEPLVDTSDLPPGSNLLDLAWHGEYWGLTGLNAFLRGGLGLYLALADETGRKPKDFHYGADPTKSFVRFEAVFYAEDLVAPPPTLTAMPLRLALLPGDWWTMAEHYRDWVDQQASDAGEIGSLGWLADRTDVAPELLRGQQVVVLPVGAPSDYSSKSFDPDGDPATGVDLPQKLAAYAAHHGLDELTVFQFGTAWCGGSSGVGRYELAPAWADNAGLLDQAGYPFYLYVLDDDYSILAPDFVTDAWEEEQIVLLSGDLFFEPAPGEPPDDPPSWTMAKIDPQSGRWKLRLEEVAGQVAAKGVDGVYVDNYVYFRPETCFQTAHSHPAGFGEHCVGAIADGLAALHQGGSAGGGSFGVSTEVASEAMVAAPGCALGPIQVGQDWVAGNEHARHVPLWAVLYAHRAPLGPVRVLPFQPQAPEVPKITGPGDDHGSGSTAGSFTSGSQTGGTSSFGRSEPLVRAAYVPPWTMLDLPSAYRRTACYTLAFGAVHHCGAWVPDAGLHNVLVAPLAHELTLPEAKGYQAVIDYAGRVTRPRGIAAFEPFLANGRLQRELAFLTPMPRQEVGLISLSGLPGTIDFDFAPIVLHSVSQPVDDPSQLGLYFVNHSDLDWRGSVAVLRPAGYGMPAGNYELAELGLLDGAQVGPDLAHFAFGGGSSESVQLVIPGVAAEQARFLAIRSIQ